MHQLRVESFFIFRLISHIADRIDGNERLWIDTSYVIHKLSVFVLVHNSDDFRARCIVICARDLVQGRAAMEIVDDIINDFVELGRYHADAALDI